MAKNSLLGINNLIEGFKENDFKGFSIQLSDGRADEAFESFLETGRVGGINLASYDSFNNLSDKVSSFLKGQEVGVYANGQKLFNTEFERTKEMEFINSIQEDVARYEGTQLGFGGSSESIEVETPGKEIFNLSGLPKAVNTVEDVAESLDIRKLSFKPIEKAKNTMSNKNNTDSSSNTSKSIIRKLTSGKGLIVVGVAAVGGLYLYMRGD